MGQRALGLDHDAFAGTNQPAFGLVLPVYPLEAEDWKIKEVRNSQISGNPL